MPITGDAARPTPAFLSIHSDPEAAPRLREAHSTRNVVRLRTYTAVPSHPRDVMLYASRHTQDTPHSGHSPSCSSPQIPGTASNPR